MKTVVLAFAIAVFSAVVGVSADNPSLSKVVDGEIRMIENELVPLAEAMPADKYGFAPTAGEFKGARTFAQQMSHIAAVNYMAAAAALGVPNPTEVGEDENGPASIKGKDAVVKYLKDSFAYAHKAANAVTDANAVQPVPSPFRQAMVPLISMLTSVVWHSFDHYGQAVIYARMNGIVPPASMPQ